MARAISVHQLLSTQRKVLPFDGQWDAFMGKPEVTGTMIIWGDSSQGKTSFALQFARYIAQFEYVAYNSLEEGDSLSMATAFKREKMLDVAKKVVLLDKEPISELKVRLNKPKCPKIIIIDSLQYSGLTYSDYKELIEKHRNKLFVFISHADGKDPSGKVAQDIRFDAHVKVFVKGFKAIASSRYGGGSEYIINHEAESRINPK